MPDLYPSRHAPEPQIISRKDPVLYSEWHANAPLTKAQAEQFDRDGYLVLKNVFSEDELDILQHSTGVLLGDPSALTPETVVSEPGSNEIRSIFMIHRQSAIMARLAADERLAGVARFLLGDDVYLHQSRLNYKPGFVGKEFYWHSDFETWHVEDGMPRMRALSMSILLAPNKSVNGPLMVMPGSQHKYVTCVGETPSNHYHSSLRRQEYGVPDEDTLAHLANEHGIVAPTGDTGTIIIFDCNLMHGSNGNITPFPRANAFFVYNAISNVIKAPYGAPDIRPEFIAARQNISALPKTPARFSDMKISV